MRIRYLKPGFWKNEDLAECSFESRLLFQGLWGLADWRGRMEYRPKRIKCEVFPYDNIDIEKCLKELEDRDFIRAYDSRKYLWVVNFEKHQHCHKSERDRPSTFPDPYDTGTIPVDNVGDTVTDGWVTGNGERVTGNRERVTGNGERRTKPPKSPKGEESLEGKSKTKKEPTDLTPVYELWDTILGPHGIPSLKDDLPKTTKNKLESLAGRKKWMEDLPDLLAAVANSDWHMGRIENGGFVPHGSWLVKEEKTAALLVQHRHVKANPIPSKPEPKKTWADLEFERHCKAWEDGKV